MEPLSLGILSPFGKGDKGDFKTAEKISLPLSARRKRMLGSRVRHYESLDAMIETVPAELSGSISPSLS